MSKPDTYTQVRLTQGSKSLVTFIPTENADTKLQVVIEDRYSGIPEPGWWDVAEVFASSTISAETAYRLAHRATTYRAHTDI